MKNSKLTKNVILNLFQDLICHSGLSRIRFRNTSASLRAGKFGMTGTAGFTLIELLIVIVIISILAALLMPNFIGIRQRARDAQRKSDLLQIQSALEMYRSDIGSYPSATGTNLNTSACPTSSSLASGSITYMTKIPCPPSNVDTYNNGNYYYQLSSGNYTLAACLENTNDPQGDEDSPGGDDCVTDHYYTLRNQ